MVPYSHPAVMCQPSPAANTRTFTGEGGLFPCSTTSYTTAPCSHLPARPTFSLCLGTGGNEDQPRNPKVLASGPGWPGSCWESPTAPKVEAGEPVYHPAEEGGWGARKEEQVAFVKRHCFARGKVLLKAACPTSWGRRTQSPGRQNRTRVCSGLPCTPSF